jgi:hypothetical protein
MSTAADGRSLAVTAARRPTAKGSVRTPLEFARNEKVRETAVDLHSDAAVWVGVPEE